MQRFGSILILIFIFVLSLSGCAKKTIPEIEPVPEPVAPVIVESVVQAPVTQNGQPEVTPAPVMEEFTLEMIHFEYDSSALNAAAHEILAKNVIWLRAHPEQRIVIAGYCDERGSDEYNLALGERRAMEVRDYLVSSGIAEQNCSVVSMGEEDPVAEGHDEISWALNRRVEFR